MEQEFDSDRLMDIEIAMHLLRLMDDYSDLHEFKKNQKPSNGMNVCYSMAENAIKTMTNPFAKRLLRDRIAAQNNKGMTSLGN